VVESTRRTPVRHCVDVLVVGAGPAGIAAAVSCKRAAPGLAVMCAERFGFMGGTITQTGMESIHWYRYEGTAELGGFGAELEKLADKLGASKKFPYNSSACLQPEVFKVVADKLMKEHGVLPLLHSWAVDVTMETQFGQPTVTGVIFESKSGRFAVRARRVVDCTGDGDIAYFSNCPMTVLPTSKRMGVTTVFNVKRVDGNAFLAHTDANPATYRDWSTAEGEFQQEIDEDVAHLRSPFFKELVGAAPNELNKDESIDGTWSTLTEDGEVQNLNLVHFSNVDALNVDELTRVEIAGRENSLTALQLLRQRVPGFGDAQLRNFATNVGVRDSRKILGAYMLTGADVQESARFDDACGAFVRFIDGYAKLVLPTDGRIYQIPLRALCSEATANILVGGRPVAGDMMAHASTRNMGCCFVTGQAAGIASAISLVLNCPSSDYKNEIFVRHIQNECRRQGMVLESPQKALRPKL